MVEDPNFLLEVSLSSMTWGVPRWFIQGTKERHVTQIKELGLSFLVIRIAKIKVCVGRTYPKKLLVVYLKFKFHCVSSLVICYIWQPQW